MFARADTKIIVLIMLMAIILAVTGALAYYYLISRPPYPEGTFETVVDDEVILVNADPNMLVRIVSTPTPIPEQPVAPVITVPPEGQGGGEGENVTVIPITVAPVVSPLPVTPVPATPVPVTAVPLPATVPPRPNQIVFLDYQVAQGDTLYSISINHNTTIALMARFGIDATDIVPGTVIHLPVANPAFCPGNFPYVVEEGDTLSSIAIKCGTTVANLMQINGFSEGFRLDVTSVICVPNQP